MAFGLRTLMRAEFKRFHNRLGLTSIHVTHDQVEALMLVDRIVVMKKGKIEQVGTPMELFNNPANTFVAGFLGPPPMNQIKAKLSETGARLGDTEIGLARAVNGHAGRDVINGVRSEHGREVGSAIVSLASQAAHDGGSPGAVAYTTSKGAVMTMTQALAKEVGPHIRVNALCPGMIDTDVHNIHTPDAGRRGFEANAPLKLQWHVDDAANLVLFLACDDGAFITGTNIDINGSMLFS